MKIVEIFIKKYFSKYQFFLKIFKNDFCSKFYQKFQISKSKLFNKKYIKCKFNKIQVFLSKLRNVNREFFIELKEFYKIQFLICYF